jgi:hypothetical protein
MPSLRAAIAFAAILLPFGALPAPAADLSVTGTRFTLDGKPTFLLGISYYGALGATDETVRLDLDDMRRDGFNWVRVWATWTSGGEDVSAVHPDGSPREPHLTRLRKLVEACDARGMAVDVTLSREAASNRPARLKTPGEHRRAVETLVTALRPYRNWYLDLSNERNVRDGRFTPHEELKALRQRVRELDPGRLVTASHSSGDDELLDEIETYVKSDGVDFLAPHRPRDAGSPKQTEAATGLFLNKTKGLGRVVPVHYQEPFRRGYAGWDPAAEDYLTDLRGAVRGNAAGWCLHNGDQRTTRDRRPGRSFDLRELRLYDQLDEVEMAVARQVRKVADEELARRR